MYTDLRAYLMHIQILEIINMIVYMMIILITSLITFFITKELTYTLLALIVSTLIGYIFFAINQLRADQHKLQIDIYMELTGYYNEEKEQNNN